MLFRGVALFGIAFIIWNLDNLFCDTWRSLRVQIAPFGFMLEGHGQCLNRDSDRAAGRLLTRIYLLQHSGISAPAWALIGS